MASAVISGMSPIVLTKSGGSSTVLAVEGMSFDPAIARTLFGHSANKYPSCLHKPGAAPRIKFRTPFLAAYNLFGLSAVKLTAFAFYLAKFVDHVRDSASTHTKYSLATSPAAATAALRITGASVDANGILMAEIDVVPLAADATTHPLIATLSSALPTLSAEPELHTLGPFVLNGATLLGITNQGIDLGGDFLGSVSDGDEFVRNVAEVHSAPTMKAGHSDPFTLLASLGLMGAKITSNAIAYFRAIDESSGEKLDTGISITVAAGCVDPETVTFNYGDMAQAGLSVCGLSSSTTHPFIVATSVSMP